MLSLITLVPLVGAAIVALAPQRLARVVALSAALVAFALSLALLAGFDAAQSGYQFVESVPWIPQFGIGYKMGVDGISIWLVLLTTFVFPVALWFSGESIRERERAYYALMLLMETATLGVFLALDMFLFYVFWEFALVPMYFIIGLWGGERRTYASVKFFIYTMAGSVLMLIAILALGLSAGIFDLEAIARNNGAFAANTLLFLAFAIAFAIKVPVFPFHTWLPDAHVEAPTAGSVILASVLLKMGGYGLIRFNLQLFPEASAAFAPLMIALAVIGILYGAVVAFAQSDAKKLVAYSSVSHMGYILLGIFALNPIGLQGAILQMVNHGLSTGGLFLIIGFIYERRHTREMNRLGGLWAKMPLYGTLALILALSSAGLPALNGFVGEFVILQGAFATNPLATVFAAFGMVLSAAYLLTMFQKIFLGESRDPANEALRDLNWREVISVAPLIVMCFVIGLYAAPFFHLMSSSVAGLLTGAGLAMQ
ncbi:MAG: NADH-quinone oxidoreductase subunit M [Chloroflexi bacterium]|jgi:NADH-quinone oxidoreductase subunit M|uniref:Fe-S-binding domain-containing protein n=1 Tax=Candidatus Thermofonsia Clade 3 bacterium TaxID=2364212 RepID=A0A2M8QFE4_9CHLR|nr:NADH-quinone oxidoreductase subunit M [Candidatus Roseilinea sp. NK_OTU-006]PJF48511.1 MAG: Fe-S-binding domain-containing protein [Candidatus Thermofonsia Clade 3 bacterium]RMG62143.1 MAG: NADH-quinone oxidoreductase subunit M [Chloroflexota bacterium]